MQVKVGLDTIISGLELKARISLRVKLRVGTGGDGTCGFWLGLGRLI